MTVTLAVTGPTGAGKTRLCARLAELGAEVVDADRVGHAVLDDPVVSRALAQEFGAEVLGDDGLIDRSVLGDRVFASPTARERLDALVHPALAAVCVETLADRVATGSPLVILEAAVYFLLPGPPPVDMTVTVTAPPSVRLARLIAIGVPSARAKARIAAQDHLEPLWQRADRIIANDGDEAALRRAADQLWRDCAATDTREG